MLNESEKHKLLSRTESVKCPVCGGKVMPFDLEGHIIISSPEYPQTTWLSCITTQCVSCGYVMQFRKDAFLK